MAQKAILVKNGSAVLAKLVYAGDLSFCDSEYTRLSAEYPSYQFTKFDDDQDPTFSSAVVDTPTRVS